jgi:hypothetical protein
MILEGVLTTVNEPGGPHLSVIGPNVDESISRFELRPFFPSRTLDNLTRHPQAVFHVTDDVELMAAIVCGQTDRSLEMFPATEIVGFVLAGACRAYELNVTYRDLGGTRAVMACDVRRVHRQRDFFGFNRAKHAVLEAAILASRIGFLPRAEIEQQWPRLRSIVEKTGGVGEQRAFTILTAYIESPTGVTAE